MYRHVTGRALAAQTLESSSGPRALPARARATRAIRRAADPCAPAVSALDDPARGRRGRLRRRRTRAARPRAVSTAGSRRCSTATRCVLCGGCVDVCPTLCLKLVPLSRAERDRRSRCGDRGMPSAPRPTATRTPPSSRTRTVASAARCASSAARSTPSRWSASRSRTHLEDRMTDRHLPPPQARRARVSTPSRCRRRDFLGMAALWSAMRRRSCSRSLGMARLPKAAVLPSPSKKFRVTSPSRSVPGSGVRAAGSLGGRLPGREGVYAISMVCTHLGCIVKAAADGFHARATARASRRNGQRDARAGAASRLPGSP